MTGVTDATFAQAVSVGVEVARMSAVLDAALLDALIEQGEKALDSGVIDPVEIGASAPDLRRQVEFLKVFRTFRQGVEPFFQEQGA